MTRTMKDKDNQMETSNRVFNCFSFLLELWYNSNEKRKTKGKEWKTTSCRGRAFSRSLWISPNRPRCCCPSDSCLGDRKVCIRCQKLKREEYIKEFIVCKAKPRALPMWYNQMHCIQKHLNFKTRYIATYIKKAHNLALSFSSSWDKILPVLVCLRDPPPVYVGQVGWLRSTTRDQWWVTALRAVWGVRAVIARVTTSSTTATTTTTTAWGVRELL